VPGADLRRPVGAHDEQPVQIRLGHQRVDQRQRHRIGPLQVVDDEHQRALGRHDGA
jgi:hypothetical protein